MEIFGRVIVSITAVVLLLLIPMYFVVKTERRCREEYAYCELYQITSKMQRNKAIREDDLQSLKNLQRLMQGESFATVTKRKSELLETEAICIYRESRHLEDITDSIETRGVFVLSEGDILSLGIRMGDKMIVCHQNAGGID